MYIAESGDHGDNAPEPASPSDLDPSSVATAQVVGILPGMGAYTDSSDSDSNSSESDIDVSTFKRHAHVVVCSHSANH